MEIETLVTLLKTLVGVNLVLALGLAITTAFFWGEKQRIEVRLKKLDEQVKRLNKKLTENINDSKVARNILEKYFEDK